MVNKFGGTYTDLAQECIKELNAECEKYNAEKANFERKVDIFPSLRPTTDCCQVKEQLKDWSDEDLLRKSLQNALRGPLDPPIAGYSGHIPKAVAANLACGKTFHDGAEKSLAAFRTENIKHFAELPRPIEPDTMYVFIQFKICSFLMPILFYFRNSGTQRKVVDCDEEDACSYRIYHRAGMIPHYSGHVQGKHS